MAPMTRVVLPVLAIALGGGIGLGQTPSTVERGRILMQTHCARCHAVGKTDTSAHEKAPAFRLLNQRYPVEALAEALAEGIVTGHSDMPRFVFEPPEVNAIIAYLKSISE